MKRGRPRVDPTSAAESVKVQLTLSAAQYDDVCRRAHERCRTVTEQIRRDLPPPEKKNTK